MDYRIKVCLLGEEGVGKTSLVARFVLNQFSERYARSLGARMLKKELVVSLPGRDVNVVLLIWDVMGERTFRDLVKDAYFGGSQGILGVADLLRPDTIQALPDWIDAARSVAGKIPVVLLGNKNDLNPARESVERFEALAMRLSAPEWLTSAKTGENVETAFQSAAAAILQHQQGQGEPGAPRPVATP
ncbi:MAG TPA: Rab family GTPase [Thermoplasmata archaeon]|nr:Rab family GTPase [Thermoplasmata archaeon]